jgi:hypothetical protein
MKNNLKNREGLSMSGKVKNKFSYGLVLQSIGNKLSGIGFEFTPYYWVQEGINISKIPEIKGIPQNFSVDLLSADDIKTIENNTTGYGEGEFQSRLEKGDKCIGIKLENEIAAFMWMNFTECYSKPLGYKLLGPDEVYIYGMHTMDSFRGRNVAAFLRYKSYEVLRNMGRDKIYSVTERFNTPAVKYKEKLNARNLRLVLYIRLFGKLQWRIPLRSYKY